MLMFSNIHQDEWIRTPGRVQTDIAKREGEITLFKGKTLTNLQVI